MPSVYNYFAAALLPEAFQTIHKEKRMETPTTATKLTIKQALLTLLLQAAYFLLGPLMSATDPRRLEIEGMLDEADMITGDYADVIYRRAKRMTKQDQLDMLSWIYELEHADDGLGEEKSLSALDGGEMV
jgi:hypothetical protein